MSEQNWCLWTDSDSGREELIRHSSNGANCRRVVVLVPEDREQVERLRDAMQAWLDRVPYEGMGSPASLTSTEAAQEALRSLIEPPRPEEPTDAAARVTDHRENIWRPLADGDWVCTSGPDIGEYLNWDQLAGDRGPVSIEVTP